MTNLLGFRISVGGWWLSVGIWLGAMIMLAIAAAAVFRTVRSFDPVIGISGYESLAPSAVSAAEGGNRHADIIAGAAVGRTLRALAKLQVICAVVAVVCLAAQTTVFARALAGGAWGWPNVLRMVFVGLPVLILVADLYVVSPRVWQWREKMFDSAATTEQRAQARAAFQQAHHLNENMYKAATLLLVGAMVVSVIALHPGQGRPSDDDATGPASSVTPAASNKAADDPTVQAAIDDR